MHGIRFVRKTWGFIPWKFDGKLWSAHFLETRFGIPINVWVTEGEIPQLRTGNYFPIPWQIHWHFHENFIKITGKWHKNATDFLHWCHGNVAKFLWNFHENIWPKVTSKIQMDATHQFHSHFHRSSKFHPCHLHMISIDMQWNYCRTSMEFP